MRRRESGEGENEKGKKKGRAAPMISASREKGSDQRKREQGTTNGTNSQGSS